MRAFLAALLLTLGIGAIAVAIAGPVPSAANAYRPILVREARSTWGLDANIALFAAQIHRESRWKPDAKSSVGARGLTQFMPSTGADMNRIYRNELGSLELYSPLWSIRAMVLYDKDIWDDIRPIGDGVISSCDRYAMMLSGYNGGPGWVSRDRILAKRNGVNPNAWFGATDAYSTRSRAAFRENRGYPQSILYINLPLYLRAGWTGDQPCQNSLLK